ncbi:clr5 domain-containing protein [Sarocladium implicatum]|nr:clr5 domain-containing protein [Sarocladium implicatum]
MNDVASLENVQLANSDARLVFTDRGRLNAAVPTATTLSCTFLANRICKEHTAAEWEEIRQRFTELYLTERRRLADVSHILRDECDFHATDKQYKDRIRKWGLKKNFKDKEKRDALAAGFSTESGDHLVLNGAPIPRDRLRRFARTERLLYLRRMAAGATLPPEPETEFDIIIELPRALFTSALRNDAHSLHITLAAIDRMTKRRLHILAFDVLGVSDSSVRYGIRRLETKTQSDVAFEMLSAPSTTAKRKGLALHFCASYRNFKPTHETTEEDYLHEIYHKFLQRIYQACQEVYAPETRAYHATLDKAGKPPNMYCAKFSLSALGAQRLYLRLLTHNGLAGGLRYIEQWRDVEILSSPGGTLALRLDTSWQGRSFIFTLSPAMNVAMHAVKRGDVVGGVFQLRTGSESTSVTMAGVVEQEVAKLRAALKAERSQNMPTIGPTSPPGPFLTDGDAVEAEFEEASRGAAIQGVMQGALTTKVAVAEMKPLTSREPMPLPQRQYMKLVAEECMVDRREPWKLRKTPS